MALELKLTGEIDADAAVFIMAMNYAACFNTQTTTFTEFASRVESLVEIHENVSCQRMMPESEEAGSALS